MAINKERIIKRFFLISSILIITISFAGCALTAKDVPKQNKTTLCQIANNSSLISATPDAIIAARKELKNRKIDYSDYDCTVDSMTVAGYSAYWLTLSSTCSIASSKLDKKTLENKFNSIAIDTASTLSYTRVDYLNKFSESGRNLGEAVVSRMKAGSTEKESLEKIVEKCEIMINKYVKQ